MWTESKLSTYAQFIFFNKCGLIDLSNLAGWFVPLLRIWYSPENNESKNSQEYDHMGQQTAQAKKVYSHWSAKWALFSFFFYLPVTVINQLQYW